MDYFRKAAITYETTGSYTHLYPNSNPNSQYAQFWKEEARRCREGYIRESDGEWITGYHYFYLNYCPIQKVNKTKTENSELYVRVEGFPRVYDGDYLFFHYMEKARRLGKHVNILKTRGSGYSFKAACKLSRNFILGETESNKSKVNAFVIANEKEYLISDGVLNKFVNIIGFLADNTPFPRVRELKDSINDMEWVMGYKDKHTNLPKGTQNLVKGVSLKNNVNRARGKRAVLIEWEEVGSFTNFLTAWQIARPSVEQNNSVYGIMCAYGTGGEAGVNFEGLIELFYNPRGYNILPLKNVYDRGTAGNSESAMFVPQYLNAEGSYCLKNGNSDVIKSLIETICKRINIKYNTQDPSTIIQERAERPCTPNDAIMKVSGTAFPISLLKDYLEEIKPKIKTFVEEHYVGELKYKGNEIAWIPNHDITPIRKFPIKDNKNMVGAIEIFEMPKKDKSDNVFKNRYILGADPIDNDFSVKGSLPSVFVFDTWTDRIVAEYTGRPTTAVDFYDICIKLTEFYSGLLNYENNLKGLFIHFSNQNKLHLLADTPQYLKDIELIKDIGLGNRAKGTRTTHEILKLGKRLQREWMLEVKTFVDMNGEEVSYQNYQKIRSIGYIEEAILWNPDGNFDRISAMDMVMILREEYKRISFNSREETFTSNNDNDDFIDKNWNKYINKLGNNYNSMNNIKYSLKDL